MFFGNNVKSISTYRVGCPTIGSLLAGRDDVDSTTQTFNKVFVAVTNQTEKCNNCDISIGVVQDFVGIAIDNHTRFDTKLCKITNIHSDHFRVYINCTNNLYSVLVHISQCIFTHFSASILNSFNFFHK